MSSRPRREARLRVSHARSPGRVWRRPMRAVLADLSVPRYLLTAVPATRRFAGMLSLRDDLPAPRLPGADWLLLRPELAGICGSDIAVAQAKSSVVLSAFYTARKQILGHEIVAV